MLWLNNSSSSGNTGAVIANRVLATETHRVDTAHRASHQCNSTRWHDKIYSLSLNTQPAQSVLIIEYPPPQSLMVYVTERKSN